MKTRMWVFAIVSVMLASISTGCKPPEEIVRVDETDFWWYPLEGGSGPGSIIAITKSSRFVRIADRDWLLGQGDEFQTILAVRDPRPFPKIESSRNRIFSAEASVGQEIVTKANATLRRAKEVRIQVDEAEVVSLSGAVAQEELLDALPIDVLERLLRTMKGRRAKAYLITDALIYNKATTQYVFDRAINGSAETEAIGTGFSAANASVEWKGNDTLVVHFQPNTYIAFKTGLREISRPDVERVYQTRLALSASELR